MEFGVALFGALVNNALPKLFALKENKKREPSLRENARSIYESLDLIQAAIRSINISSIGSYASDLQEVGIVHLCHFAADVEDCIDSFEAGKMNPKEFSARIKKLEESRERKQKNITDFVHLVNSLSSRPETSSGKAGQQLHPAVAVPQQLQDFLGNNDGSMLSNLNCLLYFCMFPCDHHVQRNPLIRRLLAEGLVIARRDCDGSPEDVAALYLKELVSNQIILPIQESNNGMVKRCKTADDILKYISEESRSRDFMTLCDHREQRWDYVRRLSVRPGSAALRRELSVPTEFCYVRTLAVFPAENPVSYESVLDFPKYDVLRLLDLKECAAVAKPDDIWKNLLMLKYLSLGDNIVRVPREVENLKMLMTLDLGRTVVVKVYSEILELPNLKHLLGKLNLCTTDIFWRRKTKLQEFLSNLTTPDRTGSKLETLSGFVTGQEIGFAILLSYMKRLKKVKIWCTSTPSKKNLKKLKKGIEMFLSESFDRSLCIDFPKSDGQLVESKRLYGQLVESLEVRPAASSTSTATGTGSIASLKLSGELKKFPKFIGSMTDIKEVCLSWTNLKGAEIICGLSTLRLLVYLKLEEKKLEALDINSSHFEALQRISLVGIESLGIEIKAGALRRLVSLQLICENLGAHPGAPSVEIKHMLELKEIVLHSAISLGTNAVIRGKWERAAKTHRNEPMVSFLAGS